MLGMLRWSMARCATSVTRLEFALLWAYALSEMLLTCVVASRGCTRNQPMRTLLVTHLIPYPPDTGGKAVAWDTLRSLARLGSVDLCAFVPPWTRVDGMEHVSQVAGRVVTLPLRRRSPRVFFLPLCAARGVPYYILRDYSDAMRRRIREMAPAYDVIVADSLYTAPYVADLDRPRILQEHNVESHLVEAFLSRRGPLASGAGQFELRHLRAFERDSCNVFDAIVALSDLDRRRLEALGVRGPITVAPPAVDPVEATPDGPERRNVVYLGTHHWPPIADGLRWYLREVHPHVSPHLQHAQVVFAGPRPPHDVQSAAERGGIRVLGYVENTDSIYHSAAVFMVPLRIGGGVRLKILHALARGLAVVSTTAGCEGLDLVPDRHLLVADDPREFAAAVLRVLRDPELRRRLGAEGRAHVLDRFSVERRDATLAALAEKVSGKSRVTRPIPRPSRRGQP